jgi:hypothetical protein
MKRKRDIACPPWTSLDNNILAACMHFCNASDLFALGRTCTVFREAACLVLSQAESLHLSVLNGPNKTKHLDECITRLLTTAHGSLQKLETSGLHRIRGYTWLGRTLQQCHNLTALDCSNCLSLDPRVFQNAIASSTCSMVHLNLQGCRRVDSGVVKAVARTWRELETLQLGGCSQTIDDDCLRFVCYLLRHLRVLDLSGLKRISNEGIIITLPSSLECLDLSGCEQVCFTELGHISHQLQTLAEEGDIRALAEHSVQELWTMLEPRMDAMSRHAVEEIRSVPFSNLLATGWNLRVLNLSHCGIAHSTGLPSGILGFLACFSGGLLREVNISGCSNVTNVDIKILAVTCARALTCLEARACSIGDDALKALGEECINLAILDVSACFDITNEGVMCLCSHNGVNRSDNMHVITSPDFRRSRRGCPALRSLKLAHLSNLTDDAILAVGGLRDGSHDGKLRSENGGLKKLLLLDVRSCVNISSRALEMVMAECRSLIEVEARGRNGRSISRDSLPRTPRFLNGRRLAPRQASTTSCHRRCTVSDHLQRLKATQGVRLQPMFHCVDCKLLSSANRGICSACAAACHEGHVTYFGSMTRFYCDCAFGISRGAACKALSPDTLCTSHGSEL